MSVEFFVCFAIGLSCILASYRLSELSHIQGFSFLFSTQHVILYFILMIIMLVHSQDRVCPKCDFVIEDL